MRTPNFYLTLYYLPHMQGLQFYGYVEHWLFMEVFTNIYRFFHNFTSDHSVLFAFIKTHPWRCSSMLGREGEGKGILFFLELRLGHFKSFHGHFTNSNNDFGHSNKFLLQLQLPIYLLLVPNTIQHQSYICKIQQ